MTSLNAIEVWFSGFERSKGSADLLNIYHLSKPSICGIQVRRQTAKYNASWYITAVAADVRSRTFSQALVVTGFPDFPWLELFTQRHERDGKPRDVYIVQTGRLALRITVVIADVV